MEKRKSKIVILAVGEFPTHPVPLSALREADFVVCCDSAYNSIKNENLGIRNYIVIGDGDSLSDSDKQQLGDRWIHVAEQDYNDLHKAMLWATTQFGIQNSEFRILGATGKREDHTLGNISYLVTFAEEYPGIDLSMLTDHGLLRSLAPGTHRVQSFPRQQISIFVMDPATALTSDGLRWPLCQMHPHLWWQATLNESIGSSFALSSTGWIILFQTHEKKD